MNSPRPGAQSVEAIVELQSISRKLRPRRNVLSNRAMKVMLPTCPDNRRVDLSSFSIQQSEHNCLTFRTATANLRVAPISMHVPRFSTNEGLIGLNGASHLIDGPMMPRNANTVEHEPLTPPPALQQR